MIPKTSIDAWVATQIGCRDTFARNALESYQLLALHNTLRYAKASSPFWRERLEDVEPAAISSLTDLVKLPFTTSQDIRQHGERMCCVPQDAVARIVTMYSSGTTGEPKRLFFTQRDLDGTMEFFEHGMRTMVAGGDCVMILLPGATPDSTGDLLARGLEKSDVKSICYGLVHDPLVAVEAAKGQDATCLIGFPLQILGMARMCEQAAVDYRPKSVLLCSDYVPDSLRRELARIWNCKTYAHYGTVETGLGGAVECQATAGCHLREADLLVEIVDPETGAPLPDGAWGEIVFTTLSREALPLIRYRTGDEGRLLSEVCACGSELRRLDKVKGRIRNRALLKNGHALHLATLDEVLLDHPLIMDFEVMLERQDGKDRLRVLLFVLPAALCRAVETVADVEERLQRDVLEPAGISSEVLGLQVDAEAWAPGKGATAKRCLHDMRH